MQTLQPFHPAGAEDAPAVLALIREYYAFDQIAFDPDIVQPALTQLLADASLGRVWLIRQQETNVGYLILTFGFDLEVGGRHATVTDLYLQPQARQQGLGTAALTLVEQTCRALGIRAFELQVAGTNRAAQGFYEKFGMTKHDRVPMSKVAGRVGVEEDQAPEAASGETHAYLEMIWPPHLLGSPPAAIMPPGYSLRAYQPGDEPGFLRLMALAEFTEWEEEKMLTEWFARILPQGWFMAVHDATGEIVATAMACYDHTERHPFGGALGWVAGDPAHAGKGLGMAVSAAVTARLMSAGYRDIHLDTEDERLAAIKVYLKLGYVPLLYAPDMPTRWQAVYRQLNWPAALP